MGDTRAKRLRGLDDSERVCGEPDAKANLVNLPPSTNIRIRCFILFDIKCVSYPNVYLIMVWLIYEIIDGDFIFNTKNYTHKFPSNEVLKHRC